MLTSDARTDDKRLPRIQKIRHGATKKETSKGLPKYIKKLGPEKGERNKRERGGGNLELWSTCGAIVPTGSRWVDPLGVSRCIWPYRKTNRKLTFAKSYTAKVGEAKYIEKRLADRPSWFLLVSVLVAIGFRRADPLGVSQCICRYRTKREKHVVLLKLEN